MWRAFCVLIAAVSVGSCASAPVATEVIPIENVINQLKIELARYQLENAQRPLHSTRSACGSNQPAKIYMTPKTAKVTLKTVVGQTASGSFALGVIPLGTVTPKFSANASVATTRSQAIELNLEIAKTRSVRRRAIPDDVSDNFPIARTLMGIRTSLVEGVDHTIEPCLKSTSLKLTIVFGVTRNADATAGADLQIVSLSSKFSGSQDDTQTLELTVDLGGSSLLIR